MPWLKTVHILCAVVWLGNFVVTGVWSVRAFATRNGIIRAFATREILATDIVFTVVFGAAVTMSGIALAQNDGIAVWATLWTRVALEGMAAAAVVWLGLLLPLELRMHALAKTGSDDGRLKRLFLLWNAAGWSVTLALCGIIYLMVAQPA